ncbi:retrovirus-related pol polyprotein from transposon TNT 1-94 [Tanacetum coccineum]|uniref:Retrovirus-related pol polyprotein from transposon TNT 1-94 n=1 Tax=Tanacetum coccineum TaxID=301880 RepID=A0ABQ5H7N9_9ASTR
MGYLVRAYYSISPSKYYKDDSCWSADLKSNTTEDGIGLGSFMEVLVLNHYRNYKEENVKYDYGEIEAKNVELENSVAKLILENKRLCNEINHVKQVFKEQFDSTKKTRVRTKEQSDSLINKLNLKSAENEDLKAQIQDKLNLEPLAPRLLQNREAHIDYLKYTQEQADILWEIVKQAKAKQPLDKELDFACKHAQQIQELLVYVQDTCPNAINLSAKKVESSTTSDSNTPVLSPTGLKCSTSNYGSKPTGNKKNDRISRTPSRNMKNKVEVQPRKVNKKNHVVEPIRDVDVKHSLLNANSEPICATCKKSMFDGVHDMCLLDFVKNVNSHAKYAKKHKKQNIWKPTGPVFTEVGLKWKPIGRTFTIVGSSKKAKIVESKNANHSEPNHTWGSNATDIPSSSSLVMTGCLDCSLLDSGTTILQELWGMVTISWEMLLSQKFLSQDEAPKAIIKCIKNIQVRLNATVQNVRTDNGIEFFNQTLREVYENVGISHQTSVARTPQ